MQGCQKGEAAGPTLGLQLEVALLSSWLAAQAALSTTGTQTKVICLWPCPSASLCCVPQLPCHGAAKIQVQLQLSWART